MTSIANDHDYHSELLLILLLSLIIDYYYYHQYVKPIFFTARLWGHHFANLQISTHMFHVPNMLFLSLCIYTKKIKCRPASVNTVDLRSLMQEVLPWNQMIYPVRS